jgi:hypothetical protein
MQPPRLKARASTAAAKAKGFMVGTGSAKRPLLGGSAAAGAHHTASAAPVYSRLIG